MVDPDPTPTPTPDPEPEPEPDIPDDDNVMQLHFTTTEENQVVDLGYCLGCAEKPSTNPEVTGGTIYWGDGEYVTFTGTETDTDKKFQHIYKTIGENILTITGKIKWGNHKDPLTTNNTKDIRKVLTSITIPAGKKSPIYDVGTHAFQDSRMLLSIPPNLFETCTKTESFEDCFTDCMNLESIPSGLFDKCTNVTRFVSCFYSCDKLTTIPDNLFDNCPKVVNFRYCFFYCENLESIPEHLFDKNKAVTDFTECFYNCMKVTSNVPELWISHATATHYGCFRGCTNASNYNDIPSEWKKSL